MTAADTRRQARRRQLAEAIAAQVPVSITGGWDEHVTLVDHVLALATDRIRREEVHWIADAMDEVGAYAEAGWVRDLLTTDEQGRPRIDPPTEPLATVTPLRRIR